MDENDDETMKNEENEEGTILGNSYNHKIARKIVSNNWHLPSRSERDYIEFILARAQVPGKVFIREKASISNAFRLLFFHENSFWNI